ncbi:putative C-type lectin domain family 20 member A isoform X1, partial [Clarias magur]
MASAKTSAENSIILQLIAGSPLYSWIGLYKGPWKWSDKTNISSISWMTGKPDNALGNENCGYIYNGLDADAQCSDIKPFFCHKILYPKTQQTIKLEVWSNQDMNDLVVMAVIMEK